jgi:hypothetical protein
MTASELAAAIHDREHWRLDGAAIVYAPPGATASVRVVAIPGAGHRERFRAIIVRAGRAEHSRPAGTAVEAVRWAERLRL